MTWRVLASVLALGLSSCLPTHEPPVPQHLVLITLDTVRADGLGAYGQPKPTTPRIDEMAAEGVLFLDVLSSSPSTLPSHATIFTGKFPFSHGVRSNDGFRLPEENVTLAEVLSERGWVTRAEVAAPVLNASKRLDQGFGEYNNPAEDLSILERIASSDDHRGTRPADEVTRRGLEFLRENAGNPFFLWLHYFDAHQPYDPPDRFSEGLGPYHAEIRRIDHHVGTVLDEIEALGLRDRTLLVLTADHGEGLLQHGEETHSFYVYDSTMRVPLIFWGDGMPRGIRIRPLVRTVDIAPTILALLDVPSPPGLEGVSLVPIMRDPRLDLGLVAYGESIESTRAFGSSVLRFVRVGPWKYIHKPDPELYRVDEDPGEVQNVVSERWRVTRRLKKRLHELVEGSGPAGEAEVVLDDRQREQLRALGYLPAASSAASEDFDSLEPREPDPNAFLQEISLYAHGWGLMSEGDYDTALENARELTRRLPESPIGPSLAVDVLRRTDRTEELLEVLPVAIERSPEDTGLLDLLGERLIESGRENEAETALRMALSIHPCEVRPRLRLTMMLGAAGREVEQLALLEEAHRACPGTPALQNALAYILATARDPELSDPERALGLSVEVVQGADERHPGHLDTLAAVYARLGDFKRAAKLQGEALLLVREAGVSGDLDETFESRLRAYEAGRLPD